MKNQIIILAFNFIVSSLIAQQKGINQLPTDNSKLPTSTYAVVVGISDYQDPGIPDLRFADKDAEAFASYLRSNAGGKLDNDHLKVLVNQQATMAQFGIALDWLMENAKEGDKVIIYFSGHGDVEKKTITQPGFLLCWDAPSRVYISGGAFALPMLQEVISTISIQNKAKVIVITDACRSGTLAGNTVGGAQATAANLAKQFGNEIKIMSCQPNEYSIEGEQWGGGRGAFSFHLIDALYGLADNNNDQFVTLQEVGRYLEDHVSNDVTPVSQVPMIVGNRNERLCGVDEILLASIKSGKTNQAVMLSAIDSRGIEEDVLTKLDSNTRKIYSLFKNALKQKIFLPVPAAAGEPVGACAETYYQLLIKEPKLEHLYSTMKRNYAAALQDDAQQVIINWLKSDPSEFNMSKQKSIEKYKPYPGYLEKAADLLGAGHYMYSTLQARKLIFEAYLLARSNRNPNKEVGGQALAKFHQSLRLIPGQPHVYMFMSWIFAYNYLQKDSSEYYALLATSALPNWALPTAQMAYFYSELWKDYDRAYYFLEKSRMIDSNSIDVLNGFAISYLRKKEYAKSEQLFKKMISMDSSSYIAYNNLGLIYEETKEWSKAEQCFLNAIRIDSTDVNARTNLGLVYLEMRQFELAEKVLLNSIQLDSINFLSYHHLGMIYGERKQYEAAIKFYKLALDINSNNSVSYCNLGLMYHKLKNYELAEIYNKRAIELDSTFEMAFNNLGLVYSDLKNYTLAERYFNKALKLNPRFSLCYGNLGFIYLKMNRFAEGEFCFKKQIELDPKNAFPYQSLAWLNIQTKKYEEAEGYILKALQLDSTSSNSTSLGLLGEIYVFTNRYAEAEPVLLKAIQMDAGNANNLYSLSCINARKGNIQLGFEYLEMALKNGFDDMDWLQKDSDMIQLREQKNQWSALMKKYFPDK